MTAEQWHQIEMLFEQALDQPHEACAAWLDDNIEDPTLRREVRALLQAADKAEAFLEEPAQVFAADLVAGEKEEPERVGPYRLLREIGRGGMGTVYLAERDDEQFDQQVAVKLLRRDATRGDLRHRFLAERQILASLTQPHIARLYDGGVTDEGQPYFVMEYIDGQPLDAYCDAKRLSIKERLRLFITACEAVQHAHQNLIVHRDLKPSNILVTDKGELKLLDFGIAKLLDENTPAMPVTQTGLHLMTPEYASPEQVKGEAITTASDVYQLGLLLYKLLTRQRAYGFETHALTEIARVVCEEEPPLPSQVVSDGKDGIGSKQLRGDLDAIVMTALRKEPERRYAASGLLADDVRRFLDRRPVMAHADSLGYRLRMFVRRNRVAVAAGVLVALLLVGYAITITVQQAHTVRERNRAEQYAAFLTDLFASPDPLAEIPGDREITVREFFDQGVMRVRSELVNDPDLQASLLQTIADVYKNLDYDDRAQALYQEVLDLYRTLYGNSSKEVVEVLSDLAWVTSDPRVADSLYTLQLVLARDLEGRAGPLTAQSRVQYGSFLFNQGRLEEAERVLEEAVVVLRQDDTSYEKKGTGALFFLGQTLRALGKVHRADSVLQEAYALRRALSGPTHPRTAIVMTEMGMIAELRGDLDRAEAWKRQALAIFAESLGPEHTYTVNMMNNLALLLGKRGAYAEAEVLIRRVVEVRQVALGKEDRRTVSALQNLAANLLRQGRLDEAEPLFREVHRRYARTLPSGHYRHAFPLLSLTELYVKREAFTQAERVAREAATHLRAALPEGHPLVAISVSRLGETLAHQQRFAEAEPLLLRGYEALQVMEGYEDRKEKARQRLAALYEAWGKTEEALRYRVREAT